MWINIFETFTEKLMIFDYLKIMNDKNTSICLKAIMLKRSCCSPFLRFQLGLLQAESPDLVSERWPREPYHTSGY